MFESNFSEKQPKDAYIYFKALSDKPALVIFGAVPVARLTLSRLCQFGLNCWQLCK